MTPLDAARAALRRASPEMGAVLSAQLLAEALLRAADAGVLEDRRLRDCLDELLGAAADRLTRAGAEPIRALDYVVLQLPAIGRPGPQDVGVVRRRDGERLIVDTARHGRRAMPAACVLRNLGPQPDGAA